MDRTLRDCSVSGTHRSVHSLVSVTPGGTLVHESGRRVRVSIRSVIMNSVLVVGPNRGLTVSKRMMGNRSSVGRTTVAKRSVPILGAVKSRIFTKALGRRNSLRIGIAGQIRSAAVTGVVRLMRRTRTRHTPSRTFIRGFTGCCAPTVVSLTFLVTVVPPLFVKKS